MLYSRFMETEKGENDTWRACDIIHVDGCD